MLLWTLEFMYLFELVICSFLYIYSGVESLGHIVVLLVFWETSILCSTVAEAIYIPTYDIQAFPFIHNLDNISYL